MKSKNSACWISSWAIIGLIVTSLIILFTACNKPEYIEPILKPEKIPEGWQYTVIGRTDTLLVYFDYWGVMDSITVK